MAQADTIERNNAAATSPQIGKNLFWDDVRIGLHLSCYGLTTLLVAAVLGPWLFPNWLTALVAFVGGVLTVLSVKICASIPRESGVNLPAQGALFLSALCLLTAVVSYFLSWPREGLIATLLLGAAAHIAFAMVVLGCARFLAHRGLTALATLYVPVAIGYSAFVVVFFLTPLSHMLPVQVATQLATLVVVSLLAYLTTSASAALRRAQEGLPVEAEPDFGKEGRPAYVVRADTPKPLPEEFAFSSSDIRGFEAQDSTAGKAIVVLMAGVFSVGVILYTIIAVMASL